MNPKVRILHLWSTRVLHHNSRVIKTSNKAKHIRVKNEVSAYRDLGVAYAVGAHPNDLIEKSNSNL